METDLRGALFYYNKNAFIAKSITPKKPIKILFLTSLRDIFIEEYNGQTLLLDGKNHYMKGIIEETLLQTRKNGLLNGIIEISGIVVDDVESELKGQIPVLPKHGSPWIFPTSIRNNNGRLLSEIVWNIPSTFRKLHKNDLKKREIAKFHFESRVFEKAKQVGADVIILDGYMAKIEYLHTKFQMNNKVLNIHPAPTIMDFPFCFRGKEVEMDAIRFAEKNGGKAKTGATLHFVNSKIDDGDPIAYICNTAVSAQDTEKELICRNYTEAKIPIFVAGLRHYALNIFPYL